MKQAFRNIYYKNYKKLFIIPIILLIIAIGLLFINYQQTGDIVNKDVSLKGGITADHG